MIQIRFKRPDESHILRFENDGMRYGALYQAQGWLHQNGYRYGSMDSPCRFIAAVRGERYNLPLKIHNMTKENTEDIDAVIYSLDFREGCVEVWLLK